MKKKNEGLSLIELIVVIAIVTTLAGLLVPQFMKYVQNKRLQACTSNKETILNVYEKCVYGGSLKVGDDDFKNLINAAKGSGTVAAPVQYVEEIRSHLRCPIGGEYKVKVVDNVAYVWCECDGVDTHAEEQTTDFVGWVGKVEGDDKDDPFNVPTVTAPPILTTTPTPTVSPSPSPSQEPSDSFWPYREDSRWDAVGREPGSTLYISGVPTGLFASRTDGNGPKAYYCIVMDNGGAEHPGCFKVIWERSDGPQVNLYGLADNGFAIKYSGVTYNATTIERVRDKDKNNPNQNFFYVNVGDIYMLSNGTRYIYWNISDSNSQEVPPEGCVDATWGGWRKMGADIVN